MTGTPLTLETMVARSESVIGSTLEEEAVVMNIDLGRYHGLNAVGAEIWERLATPTRIDALCNALGEQFDVAPEQCREEVLGFLGDLLERKVIRVVEDNPA